MKKICHILLMGYYKDGAGYQENILAKKHVQLGFDVSLISVIKDMTEPMSFINKDGVEIHSLALNRSWKKRIPFIRGMVDRTKGLSSSLEHIAPDILFVHEIDFPEVRLLARYKKNHPEVIIYADNHQDYYNNQLDSISKKICLWTYKRYFARKLAKISEVMWGVSSWRVDYMVNEFKIPRGKVKLLVMGGDEDYYAWKDRERERQNIRLKYNIPDKAFLIVTGGQIDFAKRIHTLEEAVYSNLDSFEIYLLVFGSFTDEVSKVCKKFSHNHIIHVGWVPSEDVYTFYLAADLAVFPGTHSVLWEQAVATGIPAIFKDWSGGFNHVDIGGNCLLLEDVSVESLRKEISSIVTDKKKFHMMQKASAGDARKVFYYINIAKRSIGID